MSAGGRRDRGSSRRHDREIWAYLDGELSSRARERVERRLAEDPSCAAELRERTQLARAIRESWAEGPRAPSPELLIQALRPELARIEAERALRPLQERVREWALPLLRPALITAASGLIVIAALSSFLSPTTLSPTTLLPTTLSPTTTSPLSTKSSITAAIAPAPLAGFEAPHTIYDLDQERPVLVYEVGEATTVIWMLPQDPGEQISGATRLLGGLT